MFAISDMANEHLMVQGGDWLPKPIDEDDVSRLAMFPDRKSAEQFCLTMLAMQGAHMRPYAMGDA